MAITQENRLTILRAAYADAGTSQDLKDAIGLFIMKHYPDTVTDQQLFAYWQALGRDDEDWQFHSWVLRAVRFRWAGATDPQKTAVRNELTSILTDPAAGEDLKRNIQAYVDEVTDPPPPVDLEAEVGSITAENLTLAGLAKLEELWGLMPATEE